MKKEPKSKVSSVVKTNNQQNKKIYDGNQPLKQQKDTPPQHGSSVKTSSSDTSDKK